MESWISGFDPNQAHCMSVRLMTRFTLAALLVTAMIGCSDTTSPPDNSDHFTGQFDLTHAESVALPATVFEGNITNVTPAFHLRIVATSGSIVISPNGHYEQHVQHDTFIDGAFNGHVTRADRGECTRTGSELQCSSSFLQSVEFTASIAGRILTISQDLSGEGRAASYRYSWSSGA
jgi:hypothetical protein